MAHDGRGYFIVRYKWLPILTVGMMTLAVSGCGSSTGVQRSTTHSEAGVSGLNQQTSQASVGSARVPTGLFLKEPTATTAEENSDGDPTGRLTLRQALSLVLLRNPQLSAFSGEERAAEARIIAAAAIPNPSVSIEVENFGGRNERRGFRSAETTLALGQLIELGGKRSGRIRVAGLQRDLARWDYETTRVDVLARTVQAFVDVLAAQRRQLLAKRQFELAKQVSASVGARVQAGSESPVEGRRSDVVLTTRRVELDESRRSLDRAQISLAALWAGRPQFETAEGDFDRIADLPTLDTLLNAVAGNPDLARWTAEIGLREATIELQRAQKTPDFTVNAGIRRSGDTDDTAFIVGISVPIPVFGANPGGVAEARSNLAVALERRRAAEVAVSAELTRAYESLTGAARTVELLGNDGMPGAKAAFEAAQQAYRSGKFGLLQVLDAQRALIEVEDRYIGALAEYHKSAAEVERLTGSPLNGLPQ